MGRLWKAEVAEDATSFTWVVLSFLLPLLEVAAGSWVDTLELPDPGQGCTILSR